MGEGASGKGRVILTTQFYRGVGLDTSPCALALIPGPTTSYRARILCTGSIVIDVVRSHVAVEVLDCELAPLAMDAVALPLL